jgi:hypothetical protein
VRARTVPAGVSQLLRAVCSIAALGMCAVVPAAAIEPAVATASATRPLVEASSYDVLPDAPDANLPFEPVPADANPHPDAALSAANSASVTLLGNGTPDRKLTTAELDTACQSGVLHGKPCRVSWLPILWESLESTTIENVGNIALDSDTRDALTHNPYWGTYAKCVHQFRYRQWRDDDDFVVDYIGHGMQGGIVASIFEQHDPHGRGLVYVNNGNYWRSRLKAMAWITVYEIQWKIGPAGEASVGNSGLNTYFTPRVKGRSTNETGFQDFVDTPIVGFWWNVGEDAMDRFVMPHIWARTHNKLLLSLLLPLTPCKAAANILRYKPLYYRDFPLTPLR